MATQNKLHCITLSCGCLREVAQNQANRRLLKTGYIVPYSFGWLGQVIWYHSVWWLLITGCSVLHLYGCLLKKGYTVSYYQVDAQDRLQCTRLLTAGCLGQGLLYQTITNGCLIQSRWYQSICKACLTRITLSQSLTSSSSDIVVDIVSHHWYKWCCYGQWIMSAVMMSDWPHVTWAVTTNGQCRIINWWHFLDPFLGCFSCVYICVSLD